MGRWPTAVLGS
jgi:hypothetical protein